MDFLWDTLPESALVVDNEELEKNRDQVERDYRQRFIPKREDAPGLVWAWRYPELKPVAT